MKKMKAYIINNGSFGSAFSSYNLILENGTPLYGHACSSFGWAFSDLWNDRQERKDHFQRMGIELEIDTNTEYTGDTLPEPTKTLLKSFLLENPNPMTQEQIDFDTLFKATQETKE